MPATVLDMLNAIEGTLPAIDDGTLRLCYADVQRLVEAERRWLESMRVRRCALLAENGASWIVSDLALLACQAANVPLPPSFTREQTAHVLEDAAIDWVLTDASEQFTRNHPAYTYVASSHRTGLALLHRDRDPVHGRASIADIGKITYTSGSTGNAKGVCLSQSAIQSVTRTRTTPPCVAIRSDSSAWCSCSKARVSRSHATLPIEFKRRCSCRTKP